MRLQPCTVTLVMPFGFIRSCGVHPGTKLPLGDAADSPIAALRGVVGRA